MSDQTPPERIAELEDSIEQLEATIRKMLPGRRDAMKLGGAAVIGAAAMSGTASAGSSQVGTIGDASNLVDIEAEDVDVSDTINGASVSGAAAGEALTSDGNGGLSFASVGGGVPPNFTYNDVTNSRSFGQTFTNNSGKALFVVVSAQASGDTVAPELIVEVNGKKIIEDEPRINGGLYQNNFYKSYVNFFVPDNGTYKVDQESMDIEKWHEAEM